MTTSKDKIRRNQRALKFFHDRNLNVRLIGIIDNPAFVYEDSLVLNCYTHNFYLKFLDQPNNATELFRVKLTQKPQELDQEKFIDWMQNYDHKVIYKIALKDNPNLYLCGYSFFNTEDKDNSDKKPVFGTIRPKVYFTLETAEKRVKELSTKQIELIIV